MTWRCGSDIVCSVAHEMRSLRRFGVELETSRCFRASRLERKTVYGAKRDGSIDGLEFVSPILQGDAGLRATRGFCTRARHARFAVDASCGMHIHLDVSDNDQLQRRHIAAAYAVTQDLWSSLVDCRRLHNSYCRPLTWNYQDMSECRHFTDFCADASRYHWFNVAAADKFGTFEIRNHEGTLDGVRVCNWIKAHARFFDAVVDMKFHDIKARFTGTRAQVWRAVTDTWSDPALRRYWRKVKLQHACTTI